MYTIRNNTQGKIILGDLNLIINRNEEVDLDQRLSREQISRSSHLRAALGKDLVTLIKDDAQNEKITTIIETTDNSHQLQEMERRLRRHFAEELQKMQPVTAPSNVDEKMNLILEAIKAGCLVKTDKTDDIGTEEDEAKMSELHKRVLDRITKNSSAQIQSEKTEVKDSGVADKANELEGFI